VHGCLYLLQKMGGRQKDELGLRLRALWLPPGLVSPPSWAKISSRPIRPYLRVVALK
jgi:hypothetical protein